MQLKPNKLRLQIPNGWMDRILLVLLPITIVVWTIKLRMLF